MRCGNWDQRFHYNGIEMFKAFHRWLYRGAVRQEFKAQHWDLARIEPLVPYERMERLLNAIYEDYGHSKALSAAFLARKLDDKWPGITRSPELTVEGALAKEDN